jgi:hypothetical protein
MIVFKVHRQSPPSSSMEACDISRRPSWNSTMSSKCLEVCPRATDNKHVGSISRWKLVREALYERKTFLTIAPYLSSELPIMLPIYKYVACDCWSLSLSTGFYRWWQVPYYFAGTKLYDVVAGRNNMESSYVLSRGKALEAFPMLKSEGLVGAVVYYDGMLIRETQGSHSDGSCFQRSTQ